MDIFNFENTNYATLYDVIMHVGCNHNTNKYDIIKYQYIILMNVCGCRRGFVCDYKFMES